MKNRLLRPFAVSALAAGFAAPVLAAPVTVFANNPAPGDAYTNAGSSNQGQAVGASGWYYNNVRNNGVVGVSTDLPRSGNGSVSFDSPSGAAKADIEYLPGALNVFGNYASTQSLGTFGSLTSMSYDWYRDGTSTTTAHLHPVMRVLLDADGNLATLGDRGGLVFERVYNGGPAAPTNTWTTETIGATTNLWNFGLGLGFAANINSSPYAYDATLAEWQSYLPNATIIGFSLGVGSGWANVFAGAVDNAAWTIGGVTTSTNFEVAPVPLPPAAPLLLAALAGLGLIRRRARG